MPVTSLPVTPQGTSPFLKLHPSKLSFPFAKVFQWDKLAQIVNIWAPNGSWEGWKVRNGRGFWSLDVCVGVCETLVHINSRVQARRAQECKLLSVFDRGSLVVCLVIGVCVWVWVWGECGGV